MSEIVKPVDRRPYALDYTSVFLDIEAEKIGAMLGRGIEHNVFEYGADWVIKVPRIHHLISPAYKVAEHDLLKRDIEGFIVPTEIYVSGERYCICQKRLRSFEPINSNNCDEEVSRMLIQLLDINKKLVRMKKYSLDLIGASGVQRSIQAVFDRSIVPEIANVLVVEENSMKKLVIADIGILNLGVDLTSGSNLYEKGMRHINYQAFLAQKFFLNHFWNLDMGNPQ